MQDGGPHQTGKVVVAEWKSGEDAEVLRCVADQEAERYENGNAAQAVADGAVDGREQTRWNHMQDYDERHRDCAGEELEDSGRCVTDEQGPQGDREGSPRRDWKCCRLDGFK